MDFLYFPEDSSLYLPGIIWFIVTFIAAGLATWFFMWYSKKELKKTEQQLPDQTEETQNKDSV